MVVLILVQSEDRRTRLSAYLGERGFEAISPIQQGDVATALREKHPDVAVLDLYMSEPSGLEMLKKLRQESYRGKVVALAGKSMRGNVPAAYSLGVDHLVGGIDSTGSEVDPHQIEIAIKACFHEDIRRCARDIWEAQGNPTGKDSDIWVEAERQVFGSRPEVAVANPS